MAFFRLPGFKPSAAPAFNGVFEYLIKVGKFPVVIVSESFIPLMVF